MTSVFFSFSRAFFAGESGDAAFKEAAAGTDAPA